MKLTRLVIRQLFNQFDYDISFENKENILILTGANGTGKTVILNMIDKFISSFKNLGINPLFEQIPFIECHFYFNNGKSAFIEKKPKFKISYFQNNELIAIPPNSFELNLYTHFIKENRLRHLRTHASTKNKELILAIFDNAKDLQLLMNETTQSFAEVSNALDASFPTRLLNEKRKITKEEFETRFKKIQEKQERLKEYGLSEGKQPNTAFSPEDAKVLLVYLNDVEEKLAVYDDLLRSLDLFTDILNNRRFSNKKIIINKINGFSLITHKKKLLDFSDLSTGEQHQIILLYELLFTAQENMIVLIDEPEISLHVSWQKSFVDDLLEIMKLRKMQVIIATHSPDIVNGHWNLVHTLNPSPSQEA